MTAVVGVNNLFIDSTHLTGPGYYAVQIVEHMAALAVERNDDLVFKVFVRSGTRHHYSDDVQDLLIELPFGGGRFARVLHEQIRLPGVARRENIGVLFSPGFVSPLFGAPLLVATIHDMYYKVMPDAVERFQRLYWRAMIPWTSRVCDRLLTVSHNSGRDIERFLPAARGKVVVTPLASRFAAIDLPISRSEFPSPAPAPFVLMVANLTPNKNVASVIGALAMLRDQGRRVDLVHIGSDHRGELADAVSRYDMRDQVRSLGKVDDTCLVEAARSSLAVVVASLYEGFGLPAIEAQTLGAPLICSTAGALPEVAGDAGLMFSPRDTASLANHIGSLLDDPDLGDILRQRGFANAAKFSWKHTAALTLDAFIALWSSEARS